MNMLYKVALKYHDTEAILFKDGKYEEEAQEKAEDEFCKIYHVPFDSEALESWVYPAKEPPEDYEEE